MSGAMSPHRRPKPAFASLLLGLVIGAMWGMGGCGGIAPSNWFAEPTPEPTPTVEPTPTSTITPTATPTPVKHPRHAARKGKTKKGQPAIALGSTTEASPTPEPTATSDSMTLTPAVSIAERAEQRRRGLQLIDTASTMIDGIDRSKLDARDGDDYDRVRDFIRDALDRMKQEDYLAAESLARKASLLAEQLTSRVSSAPGR